MAKISEKKKAELEKAKHEAAEKIAKEFPMHPADRYILQRYVFEPRCSYMGNQKWLVIRDRVTGKYITKEDNPRAYKAFTDSWECVQYLRGKYMPKSSDAEEMENEKGKEATI